MTRKFAAIAAFLLVIAWSRSPFTAGSAQSPPTSIEIAMVANAEAGTVALVDVIKRTVLDAIDVNPAGEKSTGPGRRTIAAFKARP